MMLFSADRKITPSHLRTLGVLVFHLLTHSCRGQSQLIGSSQPIVATLGGDVIVPCHLEPAADASGLTLEWARPDLDPRFVHVWRSGIELVSKKHKSFAGRTSLFIDELKVGNVSLKVSDVTLADRGTYRCYLPGLERQSLIQLVVGAASSAVVTISGMDRDKGGVVLLCESRGWYPEPEVLWLDGEGNLLSAGPTETARGPDGFYTVSSRVTVEKRHSTSFTCRVQQRTTNQTRETHITVPGDFFSGSSGSRSSSSASTIIGLVVGFMFILVVAFVVWKWRQNKIKNVKNHVDEETQRGGEKESNSNMNDSEQEPLIEGESDNREKLTAGREMKNQDMMEDKHHIDSEGTGRSCQSEEEKHQEKAGGQTNHIVTQRKNDRTEGETRKDLDDTEEQTKSINEETQAPPPEERDTHQEEPEDKNTEAAAQSQMVKEGIKPAGQGLTGEKDEVEETGGQTGESDATPCPTEREGQHEKNTERRDGALSRADGQTDLLPEVPNGLNKKDEDGKTESTSNEPTGEDARQRETQRHELQPEREEDTEEDNNMVTNEAEPPCSLKTETHTEQPEKRHDSRDGENGRKRIKDYTTPTDQPPADTTSDVENTEEETETNGDAQKRKEEGDRKSEREDKEKETNGGREGPTAED